MTKRSAHKKTGKNGTTKEAPAKMSNKARTMAKETVSKINLQVKRSTVPGSGKGLFTKVEIKKGEKIVEYKGKVSTWKDVDHADGTNAYIYYVNKNRVIDARTYKKALARYANDAKGFNRLKGIVNNSNYVVEKGGRVFIEAVKNIAPGEEIMVEYGKEYWDIMKKNGTTG